MIGCSVTESAKEDLTSLDAEGEESNLNIDFSDMFEASNLVPTFEELDGTSIEFGSDDELGDLIDDLSTAFMEQPTSNITKGSTSSSNSPNSTFEEMGLIINNNTVTVTLYKKSDNELCGGKEGDGWKSVGKCGAMGGSDCVKNLMQEATKSIALSSGECLDLRVKRNRTNAWVCIRKISY